MFFFEIALMSKSDLKFTLKKDKLFRLLNHLDLLITICYRKLLFEIKLN